MPFRKDMSMSTVEIETGTYIKRFAFWNPATWSIPKLYWDAWSQEQRLHAICRQLEKVIKYADYLGVNVDDIAARLKAIEEGQLDPIIEAAVEEWFEEHAEDITSRITNLEEIIPATEFDADNTVKDAIDAVDEIVGELGENLESLANLLPSEEFTTENTVKDAIDAVAENLTALENELDKKKYKPKSINRADIVNRFEYGYAVNAIQSVCAFEQNGIEYIAYGFQNTIRIHAMEDFATISITENLSIDHCNQMCYKDQKIYATTLTNSLVAVLDVSNVYNPFVSVLDLQQYGFANVKAFDNYKNGHFMVMEDDDIFELDLDTGAKTYLSKLPILNYYPGIQQSTRYSSRLDNFYTVRGGVNYIAFFDYDRTITTITQFREHYKLASVSELEDFIFYKDDIFFVSSAQTGYIDSISLSNAFRTDFVNCSNAPDDFNNPTGGIINVRLDQTADGLNNSTAPYPSYGGGAFVLKYPQDLVNLVKENGLTTRTTLSLVNDCPYVIPVAGIVRIDFAGHDCAGVWVDNGELVTQNMKLNNPDKTMWAQQYNSLPVFILGNGGTIVCPSGPSPAWEDGYLIRATYCEVYCVANAYNSSSLASCWGNKALAFL